MSLLVRARVWHQLQICHSPTVLAGCDRNWCLTLGGFSRYGVIHPIRRIGAEDFPRHCPLLMKVGLRRYERGLHMESPP